MDWWGRPRDSGPKAQGVCMRWMTSVSWVHMEGVESAGGMGWKRVCVCQVAVAHLSQPQLPFQSPSPLHISSAQDMWWMATDEYPSNPLALFKYLVDWWIGRSQTELDQEYHDIMSEIVPTDDCPVNWSNVESRVNGKHMHAHTCANTHSHCCACFPI